MTLHAGIVLAIFLVAMGLLVSNRVRIDIIGLLVLTLLGVTQSVPVGSLFLGFASKAVIVIAGMLAIGEALVASGVTHRLGIWLQRIGGVHERRLTVVLMAVAAIPSAFISDVGLVGIFIPVVRDLHQQTKIPSRQLLMPLAIAATLGGLLTMVGSVGNIVGNAALVVAGDAPLPLFAITPLALVLLGVGILFMNVVGRKLVTTSNDVVPLDEHNESLRKYFSQLTVGDDSLLIGKHLNDVKAFADGGISVVEVIRHEQGLSIKGDLTFQAGDILLILGDMDALVSSENEHLGLVSPAATFPDESKKDPPTPIALTEVLIGHRSSWVGRTVVQLNLRHRTGLSVLGLYRDGRLVYRKVSAIAFRVGDVLLVQGTPQEISILERYQGIMPLNTPITHIPTKRYGVWLAPVIVVGSLLLAAANILGIELAIAVAIVLLAGTGILELSDAYHAIEWRIVIFVAGMIPLSTALIRSGITATMAKALITVAQNRPDWIMVAMLFGLSAILTQIISNIATVLVLGPVAAGLAKGMHMHPDPLVMAVILAVSTSPLSPLANKVDLLIMGPGGYKYGDFLRLGLPFTAVMGVLSTVMIPLFFAFH